MSERVAVYPGSFDPPTYGHIDLIKRAACMFDKLIVAVAMNRSKSTLFAPEERVEMLELITKDMETVEVTSFEGLTVDFGKKYNAVALVRGLRAVSDFEYELMMAVTNRKLDPALDTVCLMPSEPYMFFSSRLCKEIVALGGDASPYMPQPVLEQLYAKLKGA